VLRYGPLTEFFSKDIVACAKSVELLSRKVQTKIEQIKTELLKDPLVEFCPTFYYHDGYVSLSLKTGEKSFKWTFSLPYNKRALLPDLLLKNGHLTIYDDLFVWNEKEVATFFIKMDKNDWVEICILH